MFKQKDDKRSSIYNLLWKYKGYKLKTTNKEFHKYSYDSKRKKVNDELGG